MRSPSDSVCMMWRGRGCLQAPRGARTAAVVDAAATAGQRKNQLVFLLEGAVHFGDEDVVAVEPHAEQLEEAACVCGEGMADQFPQQHNEPAAAGAQSAGGEITAVDVITSIAAAGGEAARRRGPSRTCSPPPSCRPSCCPCLQPSRTGSSRRRRACTHAPSCTHRLRCSGRGASLPGG